MTNPEIIAQIDDWVIVPQEQIHYKMYYSEEQKISKWVGCTDPNYSFDGDRLSYERIVKDENGKEQTVKTYKKPIEIIADFKPKTKVYGIEGNIGRKAVERFGGGLKDFIWFDKVNGGGEVILPFTAPHIFIAKGDRLNPELAEIGTDSNTDNYYKIVEGKTRVFVKSFSGIGGAAGASPSLIAHYKMNEDTADDNAELVTDGDMDVSGSWDMTGTWTIAGSVASCNGGEAGVQYLSQDLITSTVGRKYVITYEVTANNLVGDDGFFLSSTSLFGTVNLSGAVGTHTYFRVATNVSPTKDLRFYLGVGSTGGAISIDDVSVKLYAVEDSSGNDNDGLAQQDTDIIHRTGKINGAFDFNGTTDFIEVGDTESDVKSIAIWVNPDDVTAHTDYLIDLNGTDYITIVNGTVTKNGFAASTIVIYVDGEVSPTVTANWHLIILTSTVGFDANALDIGRVSGSGYFGGLIDNVTFWSVVLTPDEGRILFNAGSGTENLIELDQEISPRRSNLSIHALRRRYEFA